MPIKLDPRYERQDDQGRRDEKRFHEQIAELNSERDDESSRSFFVCQPSGGLRICYIEPFPDFPYPTFFMNCLRSWRVTDMP